MKKLLTILGSVGLVATTSAAVIACGDKTPQKAPDTKPNEQPRKEEDKEKSKKDEDEKSIEDKKKEEDEKSIEDKKKEEDEKSIEDKKKEEEAFSKVEGQNIGNFSPDSKGSIPQINIKKKLAELLNTHESKLINLNVDYTKNTGKVTLPEFNNKTLSFSFTSILDLGEFNFKNKVVSVGEIKKKISDLLKIESQYIYELEVDSIKNSGTFKSSKPFTFNGKFEFKFTIKEDVKPAK
ncbi:Putative Lipoprotein (VlcI) [Mycoplasma leachii 99/014/6]|uniref:lipoprotein n=1 Tax=Mycoplasma leachii TaxID=2105 RepID=UPI00021771E2|nr:lipoprotein [Mycoplasma leachii]CBV67641.1 Putative Lipoprotein (VlcI) [Mycoplasma leachii 99/014/6]